MRGRDNTTVRNVRRLRRADTDAERAFWFAVRDRRLSGFKFVRQEAIGLYIVDFVCHERKLVVEIDGGQHAENLRDILRDKDLSAAGYRVLRFWNLDVLTNKDGVLSAVLTALQS